MRGFWQRLVGRHARVSIRERFAAFVRLGDANDRFLTRLSRLIEQGARDSPVSRGELQAAYQDLYDACELMVSSLGAMAPRRYEPLVGRLEQLRLRAASVLSPGRPLADMPLVVWADDPDAARPGVAGGKAANLAALSGCAGVRVPPFFVVTARAYRMLMDAAGVGSLLAELAQLDGRTELGRMGSVCAGVAERVMASPVPDEVARVIREAGERLAATADVRFGVAVRSSATLEDSLYSFAGQFETLLGVACSDLVEAYRRVVASRYEVSAQCYACRSGAAAEDIAMSVLCMAMIEPAASGVAYSRDPEGEDAAVVTAVPGLAEVMVGGLVTPDRFTVSRRAPHAVLAQVIAPKSRMLCCGASGTFEQDVAREQATQPAAAPDLVARVAALSLALEQRFGRPQDVEWACDRRGVLYTLQSRPLDLSQVVRGVDAGAGAHGHRLLMRGGITACAGAAAGPVARLFDAERLEEVPPGSVLVTRATSPRLAALVGRVAAIVTETGSATGHMATVARELRLPTIVGAAGAMSRLPEGVRVTVDAGAASVYEGEVVELLERAPAPAGRGGATRQGLQRLIDEVAPLSLGDPRSPEFAITSCRTLHDVARFVHQRAITEMFELEGLSPAEQQEAHRLRWTVPMELRLLDLGGGVASGAGHTVEPAQVTSAPLLALIEGMTDPRLRWTGPVGFDLKGFMSVVVRSAADDQRYGEPTFAVCSGEYVHMASRLAYHFAGVDAMCSEQVNRNYARFAFFGGAAEAARRECRAHFLARVLEVTGFDVTRVGDRVEASLGKRSRTELAEALAQVGRLMVSARHLDMMMDSREKADAYASAFLSGDVGFVQLRGGDRGT